MNTNLIPTYSPPMPACPVCGKESRNALGAHIAMKPDAAHAAYRKAEKARVEALQISCAHISRMISHEEKECTRCGLVQFVIDD